MFRRIGIFCIVFLMVLSVSSAGAGGLFPSTDEMFGKAMPSLSLVLQRAPDQKSEDESGLSETYGNFTPDDYLAFGRYLAGVGATVTSCSAGENAITVPISVRDDTMTFVYDWEKKTGTVIYRTGTRAETEKENVKSENTVLPPAGGILPSVEFAINRKPDEISTKDGATVCSYTAFSDDEYHAFSRYLGQIGTIMEDKRIEEGILQTTLRLNGASFSFVYDWHDQTVQVIYPKGTSPETCRYAAGGQGRPVLPEPDSIGKELPSVYMAIQREPARVKKFRDRGIQETYEDFTDPDYDSFSEYLSEAGCQIDDYQIAYNSILTVNLSNISGKMTFTYDSLRHEATVFYPVHSRVEKTWKTKNEYLEALSTAGSTVTFGHYEQDGNTGNGPEPIEWIVLDVQEGKSLLLSKYGLDKIAYHTSKQNITWEKSTLRRWLNKIFMNSAFTAEEQTAVLMTKVDNSEIQGSSKFRTDGGNNTEDYLFLLSYREAFELFFHSLVS